MQPAFHQQRLAGLTRIMTNTIGEVIETWDRFAERAEPIDAAEKMMEPTQRIILKTMFSTDVPGEQEVIQEMPVVLEHMLGRITAIIDPPAWLPTPMGIRYGRAMSIIDKVVYRIIDERRRSSEHAHDVLSMLLDARDEETGEGMDDRQIRDEVVTIFIAGHETTANSLAWTWYLLSLNPGVERALMSELGSVLGDRTPTFEDLPKLKYTRMVIDEAMRLYPPNWAIGRTLTESDEIAGHRLETGSHVVMSSYVMHRHPARVVAPPRGVVPACRSVHRCVRFRCNVRRLHVFRGIIALSQNHEDRGLDRAA